MGEWPGLSVVLPPATTDITVVASKLYFEDILIAAHITETSAKVPGF
jgi:hypothetical protein